VWFYFSILGIPINKSITIKICDMNNQLPLFSAGMKPVFKTASNPVWKRMPGKVTFESSETDFSIQFVHLNKEPKIEKVYFAFCYPFSYEDCEKMLDDYDKLYKEHKSIYYNREVPILSNEGRKLNLLTITSHLNKTEMREPVIDKMFSNKENINLRPFISYQPESTQENCQDL
jgi:cytosolic carboxypeptidase protein 5